MSWKEGLTKEEVLRIDRSVVGLEPADQDEAREKLASITRNKRKYKAEPLPQIEQFSSPGEDDQCPGLEQFGDID